MHKGESGGFISRRVKKQEMDCKNKQARGIAMRERVRHENEKKYEATGGGDVCTILALAVRRKQTLTISRWYARAAWLRPSSPPLPVYPPSHRCCVLPDNVHFHNTPLMSQTSRRVISPNATLHTDQYPRLLGSSAMLAYSRSQKCAPPRKETLQFVSLASGAHEAPCDI